MRLADMLTREQFIKNLVGAVFASAVGSAQQMGGPKRGTRLLEAVTGFRVELAR